MTNASHLLSRYVLGTRAPEQSLPESGRKKVAGHSGDLSPAYGLSNYDMTHSVDALP